MDCFDDHVLGCGHAPLRIKCHNAISEVIWQALLVDNRDSKRKQKCEGESNNRPGDVFHPDFLEDRPAFFDVSVRNSMQPSYVSKAAIKPGAAAEAGEIEKDEKHDRVVTQAGWSFLPAHCKNFRTLVSLNSRDAEDHSLKSFINEQHTFL